MNVWIILLSLIMIEADVKIDFGKDKAGQNWVVVNDGVMGGLSQSSYILEEDALSFRGKVSLENNGGFASLRAPWADYDLSRFEYIEIKYRSSGQKIAMTFQTETRFYLPNYRWYFEKNTEDWVVEKIPMDKLKQTVMGRETGKLIDTRKLSEIIRFGFITTSKEASEFKFDIAYLHFK